jgi:hypothetical protein
MYVYMSCVQSEGGKKGGKKGGKASGSNKDNADNDDDSAMDEDTVRAKQVFARTQYAYKLCYCVCIDLFYCMYASRCHTCTNPASALVKLSTYKAHVRYTCCCSQFTHTHTCIHTYMLTVLATATIQSEGGKKGGKASNNSSNGSAATKSTDDSKSAKQKQSEGGKKGGKRKAGGGTKANGKANGQEGSPSKRTKTSSDDGDDSEVLQITMLYILCYTYHNT